MATNTKEDTMTPLKTDLTAAAIIGVAAGLLSPIVAKANNINVSWYLLLGVFFVLCVVGIIVGRFMDKYIPVMYKLAKFGETGGLNWLLDLGIVSLFMLLFGPGNLPLAFGISIAYFSIYKSVSFVVAATNSYFWNKYWVFSGAAAQKKTTELSKFVAATLIGLAFNVSIASLIYYLGTNYVTSVNVASWTSLSVIVGSLSAMLFNFVLYKVWVFKN